MVGMWRKNSNSSKELIRQNDENNLEVKKKKKVGISFDFLISLEGKWECWLSGSRSHSLYPVSPSVSHISTYSLISWFQNRSYIHTCDHLQAIMADEKKWNKVLNWVHAYNLGFWRLRQRTALSLSPVSATQWVPTSQSCNLKQASKVLLTQESRMKWLVIKNFYLVMHFWYNYSSFFT